MNEQIDYDATI